MKCPNPTTDEYKRMEKVLGTILTKKIYAENNNNPIWLTKEGSPNPLYYKVLSIEKDEKKAIKYTAVTFSKAFKEYLNEDKSINVKPNVDVSSLNNEEQNELYVNYLRTKFYNKNQDTRNLEKEELIKYLNGYNSVKVDDTYFFGIYDKVNNIFEISEYAAKNERELLKAIKKLDDKVEFGFFIRKDLAEKFKKILTVGEETAIDEYGNELVYITNKPFQIKNPQARYNALKVQRAYNAIISEITSGKEKLDKLFIAKQLSIIGLSEKDKWEFIDDLDKQKVNKTEKAVKDTIKKAKENSSKSINIYYGTNENPELSNFATRSFETELFPGYKFLNVESAFQAAKIMYSNYYYDDNGIINEEGKKLIESFIKTNGKEAKQLGRTVKGLDVEKWDKNAPGIMKRLIYDSFEQNPGALQKLLNTKDAILTHKQDKGKWGKLFPEILMEIRKIFEDSYKNNTKETPINTKDGEILATFEPLSEDQIKESIKLNNGHSLDKAPNGKESKLFKDLLELTGSKEEAIKAKARVYSKEFRNWFGDWINNPKEASKVVDKNGEPLIVYHGTSFYGFNTFERINAGATDRKRIYGFNFTKSRTKAKTRYTDGEYKKGGNSGVYSVFLNIRNLYDKNRDKLEKEKEALKVAKKAYEDGIISEKIYKDFINYNEYFGSDFLQLLDMVFNHYVFQENNPKKAGEIVEKLSKYINVDGEVMWPEHELGTHVVFSSNQIKSALPATQEQIKQLNLEEDKVGTFDKNSKNIYFEPKSYEENEDVTKSKEFKEWFGDWENPTIYTALNVDNPEQLKEKYPSDLPNKFYHHSTIKFGKQPFNKNENKKEKLHIIGRLKTDKVDVLLVENKYSNNKHPHITLATAEGVKPFESNKEIESNLDKVEKLDDYVNVTFKNNLRNDVSQLIDKEGKPKVFYHGTNKDFAQFREDLQGTNTASKDSRLAFFFTDNKSLAEDYGENALPVYINAKRLRIVEDIEEYDPKKFLSYLVRSKDKYDAVLFKNVKDKALDNTESSDILAVFDSKNIKSAVPPTEEQMEKFNLEEEEIGTFNDSNNIYYEPKSSTIGDSIPLKTEDDKKSYGYKELYSYLNSDKDYNPNLQKSVDDKIELLSIEYKQKEIKNAVEELGISEDEYKINTNYTYLEFFGNDEQLNALASKLKFAAKVNNESQKGLYLKTNFKDVLEYVKENRPITQKDFLELEELANLEENERLYREPISGLEFKEEFAKKAEEYLKYNLKDLQYTIRDLKIRARFEKDKNKAAEIYKDIERLVTIKEELTALNEKFLKAEGYTTYLALFHEIAKRDYYQVTYLMKDPIGNREEIANIISFYTRAGTFIKNEDNPLFKHPEDIIESVKTNEAIAKLVQELKSIKTGFETLLNANETIVETKINTLLRDNEDLVAILGENISIEDLVRPYEDVSIWDSYMNRAAMNTFSTDSYIPQIITNELRKAEEEANALIYPYLEELNSLTDDVKKRLKTKVEKEKKITSFDIFFQRNEHGLKTNRLVHIFSDKWFKDVSKLKSSNLTNKKEIAAYNTAVKNKTHVIDIRKLPEIKEYFEDKLPERDKKYFKFEDAEMQKYKKDLQNLLTEDMYNDIVEESIKQIESFYNYREVLIENKLKINEVEEVKDLSPEEQYSLSASIISRNPFIAAETFNEGNGMISVKTKDKTYTLYSIPNYNYLIPRTKIKTPIGEVPSNYYDSNFKEIRDDEVLYKYWRALYKALEIINETFTDSQTYLPMNSIPMIDKTFIEALVLGSETKDSKSVKLLKKGRDSFKKAIRTGKTKNTYSEDIKGINKQLRDKRFKEYQDIVANKKATWLLIHGEENEVLINSMTDEEMKFVADLFGIKPNVTSLENFFSTIVLNMNKVINDYAGHAILEQSSEDLPRIMSVSLIYAAKYMARKTSEPYLRILKEKYNEIEREGKETGTSKALSKISKKGKYRDRAIKRMNANYDRAVRGYSNIQRGGIFRGFSWIPENTKYFKSFMEFLRTGKIYTTDEKQQRDELEELIEKYKEYLFSMTGGRSFDKALSKKELDEFIGEDERAKKIAVTLNNLYIKRENLGGHFSIVSTIEFIMSGLIFKSLAYNINAGITNRIEGKISNMIMDSTGMFWTPGNGVLAEKFLSKSFAKRLSPNSEYGKQLTILETIMKNYRIIQDASDELQKGAVESSLKKLNKLSPYRWSITDVEFLNQGYIVLAIMMDMKVEKINEDGSITKVPAFDGKEFTAFEMKDGKLRLKQEYRTANNIDTWENIKTKEYINFKTNTVQAIVFAHGDYDELGGNLAKQYLLGKVLSFFKTWLPSQVWLRFAKDQGMLKVGRVKGRWRSFTSMGGAMMGAAVGLATGPVGAVLGGLAGAMISSTNGVKSEISGIKELIVMSQNILRSTLMMPLNLFGIGTKLGKVNLEELKLSDIDRRNMEANIKEISFLLMLILFKIMISSLRGDDDDDKKGLKWKAYLLAENKVMGLISNASLYLNPKEFWDSYTQSSVLKWLDSVGRVLVDLNKLALGIGTADQSHKLAEHLDKTFVPGFVHGFGFGSYMKEDWSKGDWFDKIFKEADERREDKEIEKLMDEMRPDVFAEKENQKPKPKKSDEGLSEEEKLKKKARARLLSEYRRLHNGNK